MFVSSGVGVLWLSAFAQKSLLPQQYQIMVLTRRILRDLDHMLAKIHSFLKQYFLTL